MSLQRPLRLSLFGAPDDTANFGVSALHHAVVSGVASRYPDAQLTVFDNGWGLRVTSALVRGRPFTYQLCGARHSRRYHRPESLGNMRVAGWLGGVGNTGVRLIRDADAVLDISGGDSFSDLYGEKRLRSVLVPKRLAIQQRTALILLPQTYGPFAQERSRRVAASVVARAAMAWARDPDSFVALRQLLGEDFDQERHHLGVDMAFGLEPLEPGSELSQEIRHLLAQDRSVPVVGLNVSGLLYNDATAASRYGLRVDYRLVVSQLLRELLARSDARLLLVPHVAGRGTRESDMTACTDLLASLSRDEQARVAISSDRLGPRQAKWLIGQLDWFCGTRMHATIAALSSGVPVAAVAYSVKTRGVFETCGQEAQVADARRLPTEDVLALLWGSWSDREANRAQLALRLPETLARAESQMDTIMERCRSRPDPDEVSWRSALRRSAGRR